MERLEILVSGRVQGVFFRAFTAKKARELNLVGWVANLPDGRVKIVAQGEKDSLRELLESVKLGPPLAKVSKVESKWSRALESFEDFSIRYDV
jgi:acylphosphatase